MVLMNMKKKAVIMMVAVTVMVTALCVPKVYADTAISPVQIMSYVDTTTNLKIYGTAQRLQYNVDSIQVILTNPPDNYGSACTPILVSFRFANTGSLPAYISTPQFEITATNSTGTINTMVYGYDPISTDLFISNYNYDSQNVGRITIAPAQEFSYYSGFVVPPNESIYFSAIVYVNASAFETSNTPTGSSEQVNQIVMSALNFYSGQVSFSADYPYSGQPIDFSEILNAITDLSDTVSTSSEMQDLIDAVTYSGNSPTFTLGTGSGAYLQKIFSENLSVSMYRFIADPYLITNDFEIDSTNDTVYQYGTVRYEVTLIINETVSGGNVIMSPYSYISGMLPTSYYSNLIVDSIFSDSFLSYNLNSNRLTLYRENTNIINFRFINSNGLHTHVIKCHIDVPYGTNLTFPSLNLDLYTSYYSLTDVYAPINEYYILRDIYMNMMSSDNSEASSDAQTNASLSDQIHQQEEIWYSENQTAIQSTGLSNFAFDAQQINTLNIVTNQFTQLWNALGNWTLVYIFTLLCSLATFILRHEPTTRVKQYRASISAERAERISYYSMKNAEARAQKSSNVLKNAIRNRRR